MAKKRCESAVDSAGALNLGKLQLRKNKPLGIAYMVARLDRALRSQFRRVLEPLGVTVGQYTALSVFCSSGALSNAKLAERTLVSPQAANELIKVMESKGWIERNPDPNHGRIIHVTLTDAGVDLLERCNQVIGVLERQMLKELADEEVTELHRHLRNTMMALRKM